MADNEESEYYTTKPTTLLDLEERAEANAETAEQRRERVEEEFKASGSAPFGATDTENTEHVEEYVGTDPIYKNYGSVTHAPMRSAEGAEADAEERMLTALADRDENSKQATGGATTYGPSVEVDPVGRTEEIVRGGTGDAQADRESVRESQKQAADKQAQAVASSGQSDVAASEDRVRSESKPRGSGGTGKPAKE